MFFGFDAFSIFVIGAVVIHGATFLRHPFGTETEEGGESRTEPEQERAPEYDAVYHGPQVWSAHLVLAASSKVAGPPVGFT